MKLTIHLPLYLVPKLRLVELYFFPNAFRAWHMIKHEYIFTFIKKAKIGKEVSNYIPEALSQHFHVALTAMAILHITKNTGQVSYYLGSLIGLFHAHSLMELCPS
jgi:hypothetical protein